MPYFLFTFSDRVHKVLLTFQGEEATETAKFADMFDKFFDCLNTSNSYVGKHLIKLIVLRIHIVKLLISD